MARNHLFPGVYALEFGGEDDSFAAHEAASAADGVETIAPGIAVADDIGPDRVGRLAYTHRASRLLGRTGASIERARDLLASADLAIDPDGTVAVRARDVRRSTRIDTQRAERVLGGILTDRGFEVDLDDSDHELRALFSGETCVLGWLTVESHRDFGARAPTDKPFFQPGSMAPLLARAITNIAGARPGVTVLDPMCGTGGVLVEAGLVGAAVVGLDAQATMARGAVENLDHYLDDRSPGAGFAVARGDAARLPITDDAVDAVVCDVPYGRQSAIRGDLAEVVSGALAEARRVASRAVFVADRSWKSAARAAGWVVEDQFERRVHRSLTRHVLVLE